MRFGTIASGSSGNCIYIGTDSHHILIDDGIAGRRVAGGLAGFGLAPEDIEGILITHEHSDHVKGLGVLSRRYRIPVYGTEATLACIQKDTSLGKFPEGIFRPVAHDEDFIIGDMTIHPFSVPHDAADPVAYRVTSGEKSAAVVTDLGEYDERIIGELQDLDAVMVEANYDVRMLQTGPYPYPLKQRIQSEVGHMSNESAGQLLTRILGDRTSYVFLGHLSKMNNYPALALEAVKMEINMSDCPFGASDFPIQVAPRSEAGTCVSW